MDSIRGVILAAGQSARLRPLTENRPKCLLPMGSKTILDWQLDALAAIGVKNVTVVVGYHSEMIVEHVQARYPQLHFEYIHNAQYQTTNTLFSLALALTGYTGDFYYFNGDVVFDDRILSRLAAETDGGFLAIDRKQCREEEVKVHVANGGRVTEIGKHLDPAVAYGEFIGVAKFCGPFARHFRQSVLDCAVAGNEMKFFEHALDTLPDKNGLFAVDITGLPCVEVDFPEDYEYAVQTVLRSFRQVLGHD